MPREIDKVDERVVCLAASLFDGVVRVMAEAEGHRGGEVDTLLDCLSVLAVKRGFAGRGDAARFTLDICNAIAAGVHLGRFEFVRVEGVVPVASV